ncbi:MAG: hypothetical protein HQ557_05695 [Bacteroidetes bacterium]|nr:hypothetical protein [Bacteroidota bacterium]
MSIETILIYILGGITILAGIGILLIFLCVNPKTPDKKERGEFFHEKRPKSREGMDFE